jgi:hypothetical protein
MELQRRYYLFGLMTCIYCCNSVTVVDFHSSGWANETNVGPCFCGIVYRYEESTCHSGHLFFVYTLRFVWDGNLSNYLSPSPGPTDQKKRGAMSITGYCIVDLLIATYVVLPKTVFMRNCNSWKLQELLTCLALLHQGAFCFLAYAMDMLWNCGA